MVVVEGGAAFDAAVLQIRPKGALGGIELPAAFASRLQPAEPVDEAVICLCPEVGEGVLFVGVPIQLRRDSQLPHVVEALDLLGGCFDAGEQRQGQGGQEREDGDHGQQFNQRESGIGFRCWLHRACPRIRKKACGASSGAMRNAAGPVA